MSFMLSQDQFNAITGIFDKLISGNPHKPAFAVLTGQAGTGKSTVVDTLINTIRDHNNKIHIQLCATTHRAASVLQDIIGQPVVTAYSAFKLRPDVTRHGKEIIASSGVCDIPYGSVVSIDESSMMNNQFLKAVVTTVKEKALKVLFIGDPYQLPPPVGKCSIFDGSLPTFALTTVHRQNTGNPILDKAVEFRDFISGKTSKMPTLDASINASGEGIHVLSQPDFITNFVKKYMSYSAGDIVDIPLCTYTNASAVNYNTMIRKATYFLHGVVLPFYEGERLVSNSLVTHQDNTILINNESVIVLGYVNSKFMGIPGYHVKVLGDYNKKLNTDVKIVFVPRTKSQADTVLNSLKKIAIAARSKTKWVDFYSVKKELADLRPPFAGTIHKIQGGTFPSVFIDQLNIEKCRDPMVRARLMYVALTRASKNVYVNS